MLGWFVYILECADGTLYTGITRDPKRRIKQHNEGRGAKFTRRKDKRPVKYVYVCGKNDSSEAAKEEWRIKKLTRANKLKFIKEVDFNVANLFQRE